MSNVALLDNRIAYGARCTWWDSIRNVGRSDPGPSGHRLPCCPRCSGMLFEMQNEGQWFAGVDKRETTHPGYRAMVEWGRGKCFKDYAELERNYQAEQPRPPKAPTKPILCLDFDGVIHSYSSGWRGAAVIPDPPVPGALQFIVAAMEQFTVAIYSSRSGQAGGIEAMVQWLGRWSVDPVHGMPGDFDHGAWGAIQWPTEKPAAFVTIDDRALTFDGTWPALDALKAFKPWNKR